MLKKNHVPRCYFLNEKWDKINNSKKQHAPLVFIDDKIFSYWSNYACHLFTIIF